jgi:serine/threonine protein phosphatase PrpC
MLDLDFARLSDPGKARLNNEDYTGHYQPATAAEARSHGWLFALADGVGGHADGEIASHAAVERLIEGFAAAPPDEPLADLLNRLVRESNAHVYELAHGSGMATTLVACALRYDRAAIAHAGDSRCYLIRDGEARLLTRDHTGARNALTRSVGADLFLNVEISEHQVLPGDVLALCCDGLHRPVSGADIAEIITRRDRVADAARELVDLANLRDGSDNISVQLIRVRTVERVGMYRGRLYKLR